MNWSPLNLQKGYQSCLDWWHDSTGLTYSVLWSTIEFSSVHNNHSHNDCIMVKDKHVEALAFMVNMKFSDSCIGFATEINQCSSLVQFLGEEITPSDAKNLLPAFHIIYGMALQMMKMKRSWKNIDFLKPFHVVKNEKKCFWVSGDKGAVFCDWKMKICLSGPRPQLLMIITQSRRNRRKDHPKYTIRLSLLFYSPRGNLLLIQGNVAHIGGFSVWQTGLKQETNHCLHCYCCPYDAA